MRLDRVARVSVVCLLLSGSPMFLRFVAAQTSVDELTAELKQLSGSLITPAESQLRASQLPDYVQRLRQHFLQANSEAWSSSRSRDDWQRLRDDKLTRLRHSLGQPAPPAEPLLVEVRGRHEDPARRFIIENIIYQSRPHVWITANLYRPAKAVTGAPGIVISHAHHTPKEHAELQTMGMTWAQAGCYVLIPDHLGHGERRQHPLVSAESFARTFRASRQDYYFRYDIGIKLHLIGESLMSWLAWDLSRAVDCLWQQPGIDRAKIIMLGSVAGGGDPCAVAAALDERIAAAVPFNFGGPQPETIYPLPEDAHTSFNYAGSGSWESTRNLTRSTADGFMPWVIVGSLAPRRLIYGHEFRWDQEHDPVWQRLQAIYQYYELPEHVKFTHGRGELRGQAPEATHCTHIGAVHRQRIHQAFREWFQINVAPEDEIFQPLPVEMLHCLSPNTDSKAKSTRVDFESIARERVASVRTALAEQSAVERRRQLQSLWMRVLEQAGPQHTPATVVAPTAVSPTVKPAVAQRRSIAAPTLRVERVYLDSQDGLRVPLVLLLPAQSAVSKKHPVVLYVQMSGQSQQLRNQARDLAGLLAAGNAVCLPDLRGPDLRRLDLHGLESQSFVDEGERRAGRGRTSAATSISSSLLMLGDPLVAGQLRDMRLVWTWLRAQPEIDAHRIKVWGDSRWPTIAAEADQVVPRDDDALVPPVAEPAACLLALLLSLTEESVHSLCLSGSLNNFCSALEPMQVRLPHDCVLPGMFRAGDLEELLVQAAERLPVRCESFVDGRNRPMPQDELDKYHAQLKRLYPSETELKLIFSLDSQAVTWLLQSDASASP